MPGRAVVGLLALEDDLVAPEQDVRPDHRLHHVEQARVAGKAPADLAAFGQAHVDTALEELRALLTALALLSRHLVENARDLVLQRARLRAGYQVGDGHEAIALELLALCLGRSHRLSHVRRSSLSPLSTLWTA